MCFENETFLLHIMPQKWIHHQPEQDGDSKNDGETSEKNDEKREDRKMTVNIHYFMPAVELNEKPNLI